VEDICWLKTNNTDHELCHQPLGVEDICWLKTNSSNPSGVQSDPTGTVLQTTTEHCLMGKCVEGVQERDTHGHLIHCNVDIDLIVAEEPQTYGSTRKPDEIFKVRP
jgi:N6-adenosine-specific RNA methylase IME4